MCTAWCGAQSRFVTLAHSTGFPECPEIYQGFGLNVVSPDLPVLQAILIPRPQGRVLQSCWPDVPWQLLLRLQPFQHERDLLFPQK